MKKPRLLPSLPLACLTAMLAAGVLVVGCAGQEQTGSAASAGVYELKVSHHIPSTAPPALAMEEWTRKVEEATGGRVRFTIYPAESLAKGGEALEATEGGVCDIAMINLAYVAKQWSLNSVVTLGSVAVPNGRGRQIWDRLLERFPEMSAEMGGVKILARSLATNTSIHVSDKEIHVPDDIKGMKIASMGDSVLVLEAAGATPVDISSGDWAMSAQKGVIVGCMAPVYVVTDRGMEETFDSHLDLGLGQGGIVVAMNWDVWNGLPDEVRAAIDALSPWFEERLRSASLEVEAGGWQKCAGQTVVEPNAGELELWMDCFEPSAQKWIAANAGKGPSQDIYDYFRRLAEQ